jgi:hypothetical protein
MTPWLSEGQKAKRSQKQSGISRSRNHTSSEADTMRKPFLSYVKNELGNSFLLITTGLPATWMTMQLMLSCPPRWMARLTRS